MGDVDEILAGLRQRELDKRRDKQYISEDWDVLLERYPNMWIAVWERKVLAFADTIDKLSELIPDEIGTLAVCEFMDPNPKTWILADA